jgi:hypothetical protein
VAFRPYLSVGLAFWKTPFYLQAKIMQKYILGLGDRSIQDMGLNERRKGKYFQR